MLYPDWMYKKRTPMRMAEQQNTLSQKAAETLTMEILKT